MVRELHIAATLAFVLALGGCSAVMSADESRAVTTVKYNYTDRYIGDVTVNGAWTGGVDAHGGGGNLAQGILAPRDKTKPHSVKVRWVVGSLYHVESDTYERRQPESKEAEVKIAMPYPEYPKYLMLHFYPDGHVEAELTERIPDRRLPQPKGYHR